MRLRVEHNRENFSRNVPVCHDCEHGTTGTCVDGIRREPHADANYCPLNLFAQNGPKPDGWEDQEQWQPFTVKQQIPLAGDVVEKVAKIVGADKLAAWWSEHVTGKPCGCADRKRWLNEMSEKLLKWAGLS